MREGQDDLPAAPEQSGWAVGRVSRVPFLSGGGAGAAGPGVGVAAMAPGRQAGQGAGVVLGREGWGSLP